MFQETNISTCCSSMFLRNGSLGLSAYVITTSFGFNMVFGLPLHCYILWLSVKEMIRGQSTEIFVFNASLAEVLFCFDFIFVTRVYVFQCTNCMTPVIFFGLVLLIGRPLFLSCICVERYLGVLHPLMFLKLKPMKYRIVCSAFGWIVIITLSAIGSMNVIVYFQLLLPVFLLFFCVKLYSCLMVLRALERPGPCDDLQQRNAVHQNKLKAFQIIRITLVSALVTYGPGIISLVLYYIVSFEKFEASWTTFLSVGIMMGFVQPLLYLRRVSKLPFCKHLN